MNFKTVSQEFSICAENDLAVVGWIPGRADIGLPRSTQPSILPG